MIIKETVRKDGLRIISCNIPTQTKVLVSVSALVGSVFDPVDRQGLFHYFEHMAFKGTTHRTVKEIRAFTDRNLLSSNATTCRMRTEFYGTAVYTKLDRACDILTDIYVNSVFPTTEVNKEKGPVLLEAARNMDDDRYIAAITLNESLYESNPIRQRGVGTENGIRSITRKDLVREKAKWYIPSNTIALAVGRVSHEAFVREIQKRIPINMAKSSRPMWRSEFDAAPRTACEIVERRDRNKSTIMLGCKVPDRVSDRIEDIEDFMCSLLVSSWSSRLWREVREKRGLAYSAGGGIARWADLGAYFGMTVQTQPGKEALVEKLMRQAIFTPITSKDREIFEATREITNDSITAGYGESLDSWANLIYYKIAKGEPLSTIKHHFENERRIINSLTLRDAEKIRRELFKPERFATVIVKPAKVVKD